MRAEFIAAISILCLSPSLYLIAPSRALAAEPPPRASGPLPTLPYQIYKLDNGLEVILSEDKRIPVAHVQVWYHVGSKDEQPGKTGFAHLFEHMMFQGSRDIAEDTWFKRLDSVGGYGINGTTNTERTNYFESVPSNQLALALWMESDRMGFLLDSVTDSALQNQKDVVRNERRQSYEMRPYGLSHKASVEALYPPGHPYHHTTIGEHEDLARAGLEDVKAFFRSWYVPANATLAIVGSFDPAEAKKLVQKYFGSLPKAAVPARSAPPLLDAPAVREVAMEANVQLPRFEYIWHGAVPFSKDDLALDLLAKMLGGSKTSRLYKRLVYDARAAQSVSTSNDSLEYGGDISIEVTMKGGHTIAEGRALLDGELARLTREPFSMDELERARVVIEADLLRGLETNQGRAAHLQAANHWTHDPSLAVKVLERYRAVGIDQIMDAYKRRLGNPKLVLTVERNAAAPLGGRMVGERGDEKKAGAATTALTPATAATAATAVTAVTATTAAAAAAAGGGAANTAPLPATIDGWRRETPAAGSPPVVKLPAPKRGTLKNGLPIIVVENHAVPLVQMYLAVYAGGDRVAPGLEGLADLTAGLMNEGTKKHDAIAFAAAAESLGARIYAGASADVAGVHLSCLSSRLGPSLDLYAEVLAGPAFTDGDFERVRDRRLNSLLQQKDSPSAMGSNTAQRVIFGEHHPYSFPALGSEEALKKIKNSDVKAFFDRYYVPGNAQLLVVGDTTLSAVQTALNERLAGADGWKARPPAEGAAVAVTKGAPATPPAPSAEPRKVYFVDKPQASQSVIGVADLGVARSNPDYVPLLVANNILGGSFSSRINLNLREKHGYSYGASSSFQWTRGPGLFWAGSSVRADVTKEALIELEAELERFVATRVSDEELAETKSSLMGKLPAQFETNQGMAMMLADLLVNDLPLNWYESYAKKVAAVSAEDVQRVARKYLHPDKAQIVVVGDRARVEPALTGLKLGAIEARGPLGETILAAPAPR